MKDTELTPEEIETKEFHEEMKGFNDNPIIKEHINKFPNLKKTLIDKKIIKSRKLYENYKYNI